MYSSHCLLKIVYKKKLEELLLNLSLILTIQITVKKLDKFSNFYLESNKIHDNANNCMSNFYHSLSGIIYLFTISVFYV